ncbi:hypothetical protein [Methylosinus sp. sav-2]|uniref:hypothetical protein n=1 Tax=Methylosinus sp. sav-2 TaxID=2485168 RepID=UPI001416F618|nr:hypothetical protein [Methylosinus sp. sav-2]
MSERPASSGCDAAIGVNYAPMARATESLEGELGRDLPGLAPCADDDRLAGRLDEIAVEDFHAEDRLAII